MRGRAFLIVAALVAGPRAVRADHPWSPFAAIAEIGSTNGIAAGGQVTMTHLGARVTAGWNPVTVLASDPETYQAESFHVFSTGQVNVDAFGLPLEGMPGVYLGLAAGYKWNTLLGHGFGGGVEIQIGRSRHVGWHIFSGVAWFPDGDDRVIREKDLPADSRFNFPFGAGWQMGASFGLALIP